MTPIEKHIAPVIDHTIELFWTYSIDGGEYYDADFKTSEECIRAMDEHFAMQFEGDDLKNGQTMSCSAEIIRFKYDNETGERIILYTQEVTAEYEHYHGDLAEHGTYF